jgi:hypothetical protein
MYDYDTWEDFTNDISVQDKANKERDDANAAADAAADAAAAAQAEADYEAEVSQNEEDDENSNYGDASTDNQGDDQSQADAESGDAFAHGGFVTGNPDDDARASGNPGSSNVEEPTLGDLTVSEFLLNFKNSGYTGQGRLSLGPEQGAVSAALVHENPDFPEVSIGASGGINQPGTGSFSVGSKLLRYTREKGGSGTTDTVEGGMGPVRGYYQRSSQPGNQDPRTTAYGGEFDLGPVSLYADRNRFDQKTDTIGARGSWPVGQGTLSLQGNLTDAPGVGMKPSVGGSYTIPNPFGLGGQFRAAGSFDPNRETAAEGMIRYGIPLGGKR